MDKSDWFFRVVTQRPTLSRVNPQSTNLLLKINAKLVSKILPWQFPNCVLVSFASCILLFSQLGGLSSFLTSKQTLSIQMVYKVPSWFRDCYSIDFLSLSNYGDLCFLFRQWELLLHFYVSLVKKPDKIIFWSIFFVFQVVTKIVFLL